MYAFWFYQGFTKVRNTKSAVSARIVTTVDTPRHMASIAFSCLRSRSRAIKRKAGSDNAQHLQMAVHNVSRYCNDNELRF